MTFEPMGRHNYQLNYATVLRDAYRLITLALSDQRLAQLVDNDLDPLARLRDQFVEDELVHLLISTAVANRTQLDHMQPVRIEAGGGIHPAQRVCGQLQSNVDADENAPLDFREACNKIIHAMHITAEPQESADQGFASLPTNIVIRGTRGGVAWIAYIDLIAYVEATVDNFD